MSKLALLLNSIENLKSQNFVLDYVDSVLTILSRILPADVFNIYLEDFWWAVSMSEQQGVAAC